MGVSTLQHVTGGQYLGSVTSGVDAGSYYRVAKADGGYDYFRVMPDGYTVNLTSEQDTAVALGIPRNEGPQGVLGAETGGTTGGTSVSGGTSGGTTGLSQAEINAANATHLQNIRAIEQAYQNGLLTWSQRNNALEQSRRDLTTQKETGMQSNAAYFSNVSPDAFQSQIGNYNQKVLDAYTQGQNTIANDQAAINNYKKILESNWTEGMGAENAFNPTTGMYNYGAGYKPGAAVNAPTLTSLDTGISKLSAGQVPQWAPNYGGLSTMQAKKKETDPVTKYLNS